MLTLHPYAPHSPLAAVLHHQRIDAEPGECWQGVVWAAEYRTSETSSVIVRGPCPLGAAAMVLGWAKKEAK